MANYKTSNSSTFSTFPQLKETKPKTLFFFFFAFSVLIFNFFPTAKHSPFLFSPMAVISRCSRAATAATTPNATTATTFAYLIRSLSPFSSSSTFDPKNNLNNRNKPAILGTSKRESKGRNVQWVFLGCPGVGKGTYASRLSNLLGVPHIATGDLVRDELASSGPLSSQV